MGDAAVIVILTGTIGKAHDSHDSRWIVQFRGSRGGGACQSGMTLSFSGMIQGC